MFIFHWFRVWSSNASKRFRKQETTKIIKFSFIDENHLKTKIEWRFFSSLFNEKRRSMKYHQLEKILIESSKRFAHSFIRRFDIFSDQRSEPMRNVTKIRKFFFRQESEKDQNSKWYSKSHRIIFFFSSKILRFASWVIVHFLFLQFFFLTIRLILFPVDDTSSIFFSHWTKKKNLKFISGRKWERWNFLFGIFCFFSEKVIRE